MKFFVILLAGMFPLAGCMSPLTDRMDETNGKLDATYIQILETAHLMGELHTDQGLATGVQIFTNPATEETARIRALVGFFEKANLVEVVFQYIGTPFPIFTTEYGPVYRYNYSSKRYREDSFDLKNVTYVNTDGGVYHRIVDSSNKALYYNKFIKAVTPEFHDLLSKAVVNGLDLTATFYKKADSEEEIAKSRARAVRLMHIGTAIYGALELSAPTKNGIVATEDLVKIQKAYVKDAAERVWFTETVQDLLITVGSEDALPTLRALADQRLGVNLPVEE